MWNGVFAIAQIVGLYGAVPLLIALLVLKFLFRLRGAAFLIISLLTIVGWTYFWAINIFPKITDLL
jgi:hypothetical protein